MSKVQTTGVVGYREKLVNMALGIILVYNEFRQVKPSIGKSTNVSILDVWRPSY